MSKFIDEFSRNIGIKKKFSYISDFLDGKMQESNFLNYLELFTFDLEHGMHHKYNFIKEINKIKNRDLTKLENINNEFAFYIISSVKLLNFSLGRGNSSEILNTFIQNEKVNLNLKYINFLSAFKFINNAIENRKLDRAKELLKLVTIYAHSYSHSGDYFIKEMDELFRKIVFREDESKISKTLNNIGLKINPLKSFKFNWGNDQLALETNMEIDAKVRPLMRAIFSSEKIDSFISLFNLNESEREYLSLLESLGLSIKDVDIEKYSDLLESNHEQDYCLS